MAGKEGKNVRVPGEVSQAHEVDVFEKKCVVITNCEKSAEAIVLGKETGKGRTIVSPYETNEGGQHYESRISGKPELPAEG